MLYPVGVRPAVLKGRQQNNERFVAMYLCFLTPVYQRIKLCCNPRRRIRRHILGIFDETDHLRECIGKKDHL
jgi:hypothetical protein